MTLQKSFVGVVALGALLWGGPPAASAHEMTERYIPIGHSPGVSGKYTVIGKVVAANPRDQTVAIVGSAGTWSAKVTPRTKIWLDRSKLRLTNLKGTFSDVRPGSIVEVKHQDHQRGVSGGPAEWIKVQVSASP